MAEQTRRLTLQGLARVEGAGRLHVSVVDGVVARAELNIYEAPRFFESLLRGRDFREAPDITSRICGICPVAYQVSATNALEQACGVELSDGLRALRRLLYCGEWIASHVLHVYFLHAPDFLGCADAVELARHQRVAVERGLALKKAGNAILEQLGGRPIHPVTVRVGGFYRVPTRAELAPLAEQLRRALDDAVQTVAWVAGFEFPDAHLDCDLLALRGHDRYPIENGTVASTGGAAFAPAAFAPADLSAHVTEHQVPHSTALHALLDGHRYLTGPIARYALNSSLLSPVARQAAADAGLGDECRNPFRSIVIRGVETVYAVEEALRLIDEYERPEEPAVEVAPREAVGHGVSEAPRGLLYHRYAIGADGAIREAVIVPPTAQNQAVIEDDVRAIVTANPAATDAELTDLCERAVRNHDPCISCAAHFLQTTIERR
ncbi:Ni/Fe hydrogenase subunit alpha [Gordonia sp. NPDC003424]